MQKMRLVELPCPENVANAELRTRALISPKAKWTRHYVAYDDGREVAFVSLDINARVDYLVLYEMFVPERLRTQGIGSRVLLEIERTARNLAYHKVTLLPQPIDPAISRDVLIGWYRKRGYTARVEFQEELEKSLI